jgi:altronate dehydratase
MEEMGEDSSRLGFASIQLDGGIDKVIEKVEAWFVNQLTAVDSTTRETVGLEALRIGISSDGPVSAAAGEQLAELTKMIVGAGGTVVIPENSGLLATANYVENVMTSSNVPPSLAYGEHIRQSGFHIMDTPTAHWVETMTGLAATGVELIIVLANQRPMQTHPFVPVLQLSSESFMQHSYAKDLDLLLTGNPSNWNDQILESCKQVIEHNYTPRLFQQGNVDFQFTRGLLGVSL